MDDKPHVNKRWVLIGESERGSDSVLQFCSRLLHVQDSIVSERVAHFTDEISILGDENETMLLGPAEDLWMVASPVKPTSAS
jgi:hypothetical protein